MINLKAGLKVSLLSVLIFAGSVSTTAQADHESNSILPFIAAGVFASLLYKNTHRYRYETKRYYSRGNHGGYHGSRHQHRRHSYSQSGYQYKARRKYRH